MPAVNLWLEPSLLLQKITGPEMEYSEIFSVPEEGRQGIIVFGTDYSTIETSVRDGRALILRKLCLNADKGGSETELDSLTVPEGCTQVRLGVTIRERRNYEMPDYDGKDTYSAICTFHYTIGSSEPQPLGPDFIAKPGRWIGAKTGSFKVGK